MSADAELLARKPELAQLSNELWRDVADPKQIRILKILIWFVRVVRVRD